MDEVLPNLYIYISCLSANLQVHFQMDCLLFAAVHIVENFHKIFISGP